MKNIYLLLGILLICLPGYSQSINITNTDYSNSLSVSNTETEDNQNLPVLDTIIVTATRQRSHVMDSTFPVNVISEENIEHEMPSSMADLFENEPGLSASTTGGGSVRPMIRGLYDDQVLILLDGIRLSEQRAGGNHVLSIDPALISQVEVIRGRGCAGDLHAGEK